MERGKPTKCPWLAKLKWEVCGIQNTNEKCQSITRILTWLNTALTAWTAWHVLIKNSVPSRRKGEDVTGHISNTHTQVLDTHSNTQSDLVAPQSCSEQTAELQISQGPFQAQ